MIKEGIIMYLNSYMNIENLKSQKDSSNPEKEFNS